MACGMNDFKGGCMLFKTYTLNDKDPMFFKHELYNIKNILETN